MQLYLSVDGGRVQEEGDLLHRLPVAANLPGHVVASNQQMVASGGVGVGDLHCGGALQEHNKRSQCELC